MTIEENEESKLRTVEEKAQLVDDILEEYQDFDSKEACDNCEDCGQIFMCAFHSILSLLSGRTKTNVEINRIRAKNGSI